MLAHTSAGSGRGKKCALKLYLKWFVSLLDQKIVCCESSTDAKTPARRFIGVVMCTSGVQLPLHRRAHWRTAVVFVLFVAWRQWRPFDYC